MKKLKFHSFWVIFLIITFVFGLSKSATAQQEAAAEFYSKNTVTLIVPTKPGGGTDYAARVIADYWEKTTGGNMIVKNMPGANSLLGVNHVYSSKADGLTLGVSETATMTPAWLFKLSGVQFDVEKLTWFSLIAPVPYAFVISAKLPAKSMQEVQQMDGFRMGSSDVSGTDTLAMVLIADAFNLKNAKVISGFTGTADIGLAIARGELEGAAYHPFPLMDWTAKGYVKKPPLVTVWPERVPVWPETPTINEMVKLSPEQQKIYNLFIALKSCKVFYGPPNIPKERVKFVQDLSDKMIYDEKFLVQVKKRFKVWLKPMNSMEVSNYMGSLKKEVTDEDIATVRKILKTKYDLGQ
jgi:tripartite-type tricarboxylate transporter receptor subunit TctC